jgi:hypothetical protein
MSEPADATTTSAPATATPPHARAWPRRLWLAGRILVTIGAVGFAIFAWAWWWKVDGQNSAGTSGPLLNYVLLLTPGDIRGGSHPFIFHTLTILGLLIVPFLWLAKRRRGSILAMEANILWVLFLSILVLDQVPLHSVSLIDGLSPHEFAITGAPQAQVGFWIGLTALVLSILGALALIVATGWSTFGAHRGINWKTQRARVAAADLVERSAIRPRLARLPGAGGLTLGLVIFLIAILGMGWTAVNCTDRPLFLGQCTGLTFTGVLHYGIATQTDAFDPIAALYAIPALLVGGAILIAIGLWWWRRLTPGFSLWLTLYLAAATFFFIVAYAGTGAIAAHSADLGLQPGTWSAQAGLWVAALGLLIGWLALIPLWFRALRPTSTATATATA